MATAIAEAVLKMDQDDEATPDRLRLLNIHLIRLLYWWGDGHPLLPKADKTRAWFNMSRIGQYVARMGSY